MQLGQMLQGMVALPSRTRETPRTREMLLWQNRKLGGEQKPEGRELSNTQCGSNRYAVTNSPDNPDVPGSQQSNNRCTMYSSNNWCCFCEPGTYTPNGVNVQSQADCLSCPFGTYSDASTVDTVQGSCLMCPSGKYQDQSGQSSCTSCDSGQTTFTQNNLQSMTAGQTIGATSVEDCVEVPTGYLLKGYTTYSSGTPGLTTFWSACASFGKVLEPDSSLTDGVNSESQCTFCAFPTDAFYAGGVTTLSAITVCPPTTSCFTSYVYGTRYFSQSLLSGDGSKLNLQGFHDPKSSVCLSQCPAGSGLTMVGAVKSCSTCLKVVGHYSSGAGACARCDKYSYPTADGVSSCQKCPYPWNSRWNAAFESDPVPTVQNNDQSQLNNFAYNQLAYVSCASMDSSLCLCLPAYSVAIVCGGLAVFFVLNLILFVCCSTPGGGGGGGGGVSVGGGAAIVGVKQGKTKDFNFANQGIPSGKIGSTQKDRAVRLDRSSDEADLDADADDTHSESSLVTDVSSALPSLNTQDPDPDPASTTLGSPSYAVTTLDIGKSSSSDAMEGEATRRSRSSHLPPVPKIIGWKIAIGLLAYVTIPLIDSLSDLAFIISQRFYSIGLFVPMIVCFCLPGLFFFKTLADKHASPRFYLVPMPSSLIFDHYDTLYKLILGVLTLIPFLFLNSPLLLPWIVIGILLYSTKAFAVRPVSNLWLHIWTGDRWAKEGSPARERYDNDLALATLHPIDERVLNESLYSHILGETFPILVIQIINNLLSGSFTPLGLFSVAFSVFNALSGLYRILYFKLWLRIPLVSIPVDLTVMGLSMFGKDTQKKLFGAANRGRLEHKHRLSVQRTDSGHHNQILDDWSDSDGLTHHDAVPESANPVLNHAVEEILTLKALIVQLTTRLEALEARPHGK